MRLYRHDLATGARTFSTYNNVTYWAMQQFMKQAVQREETENPNISQSYIHDHHAILINYNGARAVEFGIVCPCPAEYVSVLDNDVVCYSGCDYYPDTKTVDNIRDAPNAAAATNANLVEEYVLVAGGDHAGDQRKLTTADGVTFNY